ncbi:MAG TPA: toxic anion resistance protein [Eggerthellaceae bacterium]|nr:toxic anion resistance protein [Eggerthellaceae bacterium]
MDFDLNVPDLEKAKETVEEELAVTEQHAEVIDSAAAQKGEQIMAIDLDSFAERRALTKAVEEMGSDIVRKSATKNDMLSRSMSQLSKSGGETGEVAKGLEELAIQMRELDPSGIEFTKTGPFGKLFSPIKRYFERYKKADDEIASIVESLEKGKQSLKNDNTTLELEENTMRDLTKQLNQQIAMATDLDNYLTQAVDKARADINTDPEKIKFVEEEVLFPLRQKILDFQQLLVVNQQGIVAMNVVRRNNMELIRAVDRAENVTVSALRVAVMVAGALYNQNIVLEKITVLNETTNNMIAATSRMLKEQGGEIQRQATEANISADTLKQAFADTIQALEDISTYKQEALPMIRQSILEFQEMADTGEKYLQQLEGANLLGADDDGQARAALPGKN